MQIMINLPPDLEQELMRQAAKSNISLQTLILQGLRQITQASSAPQWPDAILSFSGVPDFPPFESYRSELLPPRESELF